MPFWKRFAGMISGAWALGVLWPVAGFAQDMPWDTPLQNLLDNITGPTAGVIVILAVAAFCISLMFGAGFGLIQWALGIIMGCSILVAASTFILPFFGGK